MILPFINFQGPGYYRRHANFIGGGINGIVRNIEQPWRWEPARFGRGWKVTTIAEIHVLERQHLGEAQ